MKVITSFIATVILSVFTMMTVSAQDNRAFTGALLWKISGNGLAQPSYVLGTHHLSPVSFVNEIKGLKEAMADTKQTVGELLLSDQTAMQAKMQQAAMLPAGESYDKLLSTVDYGKLDNGLKSIIGVGLDNFKAFKPGMISMIYTITLYTKLYPEFNPMSHEPIDLYVQRIAKESGKEVSGLESIDDQIYAMFDSEPLKVQAVALACAVSESGEMKTQLDKMNAYYKEGKLIDMYDLSFNNPDEKCKMSQSQKNALVKDRNDKWMLKIPQIIKAKSSLIAVGALHLPGEEGILYQLSKLGYKVEVVK